MDPSERRIEIFAPFGEAFELTKKILFQPFDIGKWFAIGFAAWLATFFNGGGFNYRGWNGNRDWNWKSHGHHHGPPFSIHDAPPWVIPVVIIGVVLVLALITVLLWLNSRGRFMFTDCIARNRGAIAEPWREFRTDGNRYFVFSIVITLCSLVVFGGLGLIFFIGWYWGNPVVPVALLILFAVAVILVALIVSLVMRFMVPVMYRQRCGAMEAFRAVWSLFTANPGVFVLFALFYILLYIAGAMIGCVAACATCCVAAIPYIGTVILLPVVMLLFAFPLCFLRQFGDPYNVWAVVRPTEPPAPPIPPVQESLPPE
jgi:hypothetical protein